MYVLAVTRGDDMLRKIIFHTSKNKSACNPVCVQSWPIYKISAPLNAQMRFEILSISQNFITHLRILRMDKYTLKFKHETVVRRRSGTATCSTRDAYMFILSRTPVSKWNYIQDRSGRSVVDKVQDCQSVDRRFDLPILRPFR